MAVTNDKWQASSNDYVLSRAHSLPPALTTQVLLVLLPLLE